MAKSNRRSLVARIVVALVALGLAAFAARLWLHSVPQAAPGEGAASRAGDAAAAAPTHDEIAPEDRAALRDLLRDAETEAP